MPDQIFEYIKEGALQLIPALWILGVFLKRTPKVPDWTIVWVLTALGIAGSIALLGTSAESIIQGILTTGAAVLGYQLVKQTSKGNQS